MDVRNDPVPTLLLALDAVRKVQARWRHEAFGEAALAARGSERAMRKHMRTLAAAAGTRQERTGRTGDIEDLQRWLTGGR